jgi:myosin heavy subunit
MNVVGMSPEHQENVLGIISAILHLGNIQFVEDNNVAEVENPTGRMLDESNNEQV